MYYLYINYSCKIVYITFSSLGYKRFKFYKCTVEIQFLNYGKNRLFIKNLNFEVLKKMCQLCQCILNIFTYP